MITLLEVTKSHSKTFCSLMFKNVVERMNTNRFERRGEVKAFTVWDQKWTKQDFFEIVASLSGDWYFYIRWGVIYWEREGKLFWTEGSETRWMVQLSRKDLSEAPWAHVDFHHTPAITMQVTYPPSVFCPKYCVSVMCQAKTKRITRLMEREGKDRY